MSSPEYCVVITTCATKEDAKALVDALLQDQLAACIQITSITSYYVWKGSVNEDAEQLLLIKTLCEHYPAIEATLRRVHKYETPEIVQVPITAGLPAYLQWMRDVTK